MTDRDEITKKTDGQGRGTDVSFEKKIEISFLLAVIGLRSLGSDFSLFVKLLSTLKLLPSK